LLITAGKAQLVQHAPYAYQNIADKQIPVTARYALHNRSVSLVLGDYDHQRPLIIDPALSYSSYLGGSGNDKALAVAVDTNGNIYVTGSTQSADFPGATNTISPSTSGNTDAFVTKISKTGTVVFSTYLGSDGTVEPVGGERGNSIATANINGQELIYVTGGTAYLGIGTFPTLNAYKPSCPITNSDVFVSIFNASNGQMNYSTCVGGSAYDEGFGITVDSSGNAYVVGDSTSDNNTNGSAIDTPFPTTMGSVQSTNTIPTGTYYTSFLFKLDPSKTGLNQLVYSTYMGCAQSATNCGSTHATAVAVDNSGIAYVTGWTGTSADKFPNGFPTALAFQPLLKGTQDAFFYKLDPTVNGISGLLYASYFGGSDTSNGNIVDKATGIAVDTTGNIYITGQTTSSNLLTTPNAIQASYGGGTTLGDAFVAKFSPATQGGNDYGLSYSTYLGGSGEDGATGIAVDSTTRRAYVTGSTTSTDFPIHAATNLQSSFNRGNNATAKDVFVTSIEPSNTTPGYDLHYSTYLGGSLDDQGLGIAVAAGDKAYVVGSTASPSTGSNNEPIQQAFPFTDDAAQKTNNSGLGLDAFVTRIAPVANLSVTIAAHPSNDLLSTTAPPLGDSLTYSIILVNLGPDPATGLKLTFALSTPDIPSIMTPISSKPVSDPNICQFDGNELFTCTLPDMPAGSQQTFSISGMLQTQSRLVATATVNSNEINAVSTSYTLIASQTLPPPSTTVTGGTTPTTTPITGGGGGALGPWALAILLLAGLPRVIRRIPV